MKVRLWTESFALLLRTDSGHQDAIENDILSLVTEDIMYFDLGLVLQCRCRLCETEEKADSTSRLRRFHAFPSEKISCISCVWAASAWQYVLHKVKQTVEETSGMS